jgi:hypothetical protein
MAAALVLSPKPEFVQVALSPDKSSTRALLSDLALQL